MNSAHDPGGGHDIPAAIHSPGHRRGHGLGLKGSKAQSGGVLTRRRPPVNESAAANPLTLISQEARTSWNAMPVGWRCMSTQRQPGAVAPGRPRPRPAALYPRPRTDRGRERARRPTRTPGKRCLRRMTEREAQRDQPRRTSRQRCSPPTTTPRDRCLRRSRARPCFTRAQTAGAGRSVSASRGRVPARILNNPTR